MTDASTIFDVMKAQVQCLVGVCFFARPTKRDVATNNKKQKHFCAFLFTVERCITRYVDVGGSVGVTGVCDYRGAVELS